jgi:hypothetical protein
VLLSFPLHDSEKYLKYELQTGEAHFRLRCLPAVTIRLESCFVLYGNLIFTAVRKVGLLNSGRFSRKIFGSHALVLSCLSVFPRVAMPMLPTRF